MPRLSRFLVLALAPAALTLACAAAHSVRAQGTDKSRVPITRQDDPMTTRDPRHPSNYDYEVEQQNAIQGKEVERALRDGNVATDEKRYGDAERFYKQALQYNAKEARAYLGLGRLYAAEDKADDAAGAFKKAIEIKPKLAEARFNLGMIYAVTGHKDLALEQHQALVPLNAELAKRLKEFIDKQARPVM